MSRRVFPFVLIGTTWHYLFETVLYSKFDKNKCHVSYGLCTNALCWTHSYFLPSHPVQSFEAFLKGKIHSLHHIFLSFNKFETWNLFSLIYYVYTCARINIKVCFESLFPSFPKSFLPTSLRISVLQKSLKKVGMKVWWICFKALILHPLSREKGDTVDMLRREKVMNDRLMKTFWKFFFKKFWWFKNLPYLCIRFPKESL